MRSTGTVIRSFFNWSGGKDSALALYYCKQNPELDIAHLVTSVNAHHGRISMHGVRESLLDAQAEALGIPMRKLCLPESPDMKEYESLMSGLVADMVADECTHAIFGDIFLEDLRRYREEKLATQGLKGLFPLWKRDTSELIREFLDLGFKTMLVCVDASLLDQSFAGRIIDSDFLKDLPHNVDPCGENGEFHTFVFDGPIFQSPIPVIRKEVVYREYPAPQGGKPMGFYFQDIEMAL